MKVLELMTRGVDSCRPEDHLGRAAQIMADRNCGSVPVLDADSKLIGILTDRDICLAAHAREKLLADIPVEAVMTRNVFSCRVNDDLHVAEDVMESKRVRRLPVLDVNDELTGIISLHDIAREAARQAGPEVVRRKEVENQEVGQVLASICATEPTAAP